MDRKKSDIHLCRRCGFIASQQCTLVKHFKRKKPCKPDIQDIPVEQLLKEAQVHYKNTWEDPESKHLFYLCCKCGDKFRQYAGKHRHEKKCKAGPPRIFDRPTEKVDVQQMNREMETNFREKFEREQALRETQEPAFVKRLEDRMERIEITVQKNTEVKTTSIKRADLQAARRKAKKERMALTDVDGPAAHETPRVEKIDNIGEDVVIRPFMDPYISPEYVAEMYKRFLRQDKDTYTYLKEFIFTVFCEERQNNSFLYSAKTNFAWIYNGQTENYVEGKVFFEMLINMCKTKIRELNAEGIYNQINTFYPDNVVNLLPIDIQAYSNELVGMLHKQSHDKDTGFLRQTWEERFVDRYRGLLIAEDTYFKTHTTYARSFDD